VMLVDKVRNSAASLEVVFSIHRMNSSIRGRILDLKIALPCRRFFLHIMVRRQGM
jgi:hypothetical protein